MPHETVPDPGPELMPLLEECEERIGVKFSNKTLLRAALTHASGALHRLASNERLEFLGDAILGAVVCDVLYHKYPDYLEGDLTKIKSIVVSRKTCTKISEMLGLEEFLILGKGLATHPSIPPSLLADVFESLIAAIYIDGGPEAARRFITKHVGPEIELAVDGAGRRELQVAPAAIRPARKRRDAHLPTARRKGPRSQQVLQDRRPGGIEPVPGGLGAKQERGRTASRPKRAVRDQRRDCRRSRRTERLCAT